MAWTKGRKQMNIFRWLTWQRSVRRMALSLYKRGMARAKKRDYRGAIDTYTKAIDMPETPAEVKAMVLYNRALVLVATGDVQKAVGDLDAVLAIDEVPVNVRTMARLKLAKIDSRSHMKNV